MQMTDRGLMALVRHEGLVPGPYLDTAGVWTFGIGHTAAAGAPDPAKLPRGMPADLDAGTREAFRVFRDDLARYEVAVLHAVKVPLEPHEFDALVSFHYNTGGIAKAALTRHLNAGDRAAAAAAFVGWLKPAAIRPRREAERDLFAEGRYPTGTIPVWSVDSRGKVDFSRPIRRLTEDEALALLRPAVMPVRKTTEAANGELRVIGIDDWAWRKGQRYGTLICDPERHRVVDLLPDREPATVEAWLRDRPGIEVVARDRNGGYRGAVARALPQAVQVADRWHLLENASAAFLAAVQRNMPAIRKAIGAKTLDPKLLTAAERLQYQGFQAASRPIDWFSGWPMTALPSDASCA